MGVNRHAPKSIPAQALRHAENSGIVLYSEATLQELISVLLRPKFHTYIEATAIDELYVRILQSWESVAISQYLTACRDIKDNKFLELAVNGHAHTLISGDNDLLVLHPFQQVTIQKPADFLKAYKII
jgi:uncharacterized protein